MTIKVDPFLIPIPNKFLEDPEIRQYMEYKDRVIHDLYQRTGGADDSVSELQGINTFETSTILPRLYALDARLNNIEAQISKPSTANYQEKLEDLEITLQSIKNKSYDDRLEELELNKNTSSKVENEDLFFCKSAEQSSLYDDLLLLILGLVSRVANIENKLEEVEDLSWL